jgi:hypothetical protein
VAAAVARSLPPPLSLRQAQEPPRVFPIMRSPSKVSPMRTRVLLNRTLRTRSSAQLKAPRRLGEMSSPKMPEQDYAGHQSMESKKRTESVTVKQEETEAISQKEILDGGNSCCTETSRSSSATPSAKKDKEGIAWSEKTLRHTRSGSGMSFGENHEGLRRLVGFPTIITSASITSGTPAQTRPSLPPLRMSGSRISTPREVSFSQAPTPVFQTSSFRFDEFHMAFGPSPPVLPHEMLDGSGEEGTRAAAPVDAFAPVHGCSPTLVVTPEVEQDQPSRRLSLGKRQSADLACSDPGMNGDGSSCSQRQHRRPRTGEEDSFEQPLADALDSPTPNTLVRKPSVHFADPAFDPAAALEALGLNWPEPHPFPVITGVNILRSGEKAPISRRRMSSISSISSDTTLGAVPYLPRDHRYSGDCDESTQIFDHEDEDEDEYCEGEDYSDGSNSSDDSYVSTARTATMLKGMKTVKSGTRKSKKHGAKHRSFKKKVGVRKVTNAVHVVGSAYSLDELDKALWREVCKRDLCPWAKSGNCGYVDRCGTSTTHHWHCHCDHLHQCGSKGGMTFHHHQLEKVVKHQRFHVRQSKAAAGEELIWAMPEEAVRLKRAGVERYQPGSWSRAESVKLGEVVCRVSAVPGKWDEVASCMPGRSSLQCMLHWRSHHLLGNGEIIKGVGTWDALEDARLAQLHAAMGENKWTLIAKCMPGRLAKQCRERFVNHLHPDRKSVPWSAEEDKVLAHQRLRLGSKVSEICKALPGRSYNDVKNRIIRIDRTSLTRTSSFITNKKKRSRRKACT